MNASTRVACISGLAVGLFLVPARARAADPSSPVQDEYQLAPVRTPADPAPAPEKEKRRIGLGIEADVLPYILSGAHGDVWAGLDGWRARAIAVTNTAPSFFTPSGFQNPHTSILELEVDRFFGHRAAEFRGPWVAAGGGL